MPDFPFPEGYVLPVEKPLGWTSSDVVRKMRVLLRRLGHRKIKVGHAGTLDPLATGVLIVCIGRATKRVDELQAEKASQQKKQAEMRPTTQRELPIDKGDTVRIKGLTSTGTVESLDGKMAMVVFGGGMRTKMRLDRLERAQEPKASASTGSTKTSLANLQTYAPTSNITRSTVDAHVKHFRTEIDLRGMRGDEALMQVQYFIDDAILAGASQVRILHGKGNGILRQMIRQYLATVPNVRSYRDEHVQFGGAGITVVEL